SRRAMPRSQRLRLRRLRPPYEEPVLDLRDDEIQDQREHGEDQDPGEDGVDVEHALGLVDEIAYTPGRAQILADHGADEGEPDRSVQAREDPARRGREIDETKQLLARRAEHARVRQD